MIDQAAARGERHEFGAEADQAAGRDEVIEADPAVPVGHDLAQRTASLAELLHDRALVLLLDIDRQGLPGLANLALDFLEDDLGTRDRQLVTLGRKSTRLNS